MGRHLSLGTFHRLFKRLLWLVLAAAGTAVAQRPGPVPYPRIEVGEHTSIIRRLAVDRAQHWLVTASEDKTARVWNLRTGLLERTLRPPIGSGKAGMLYAVAISPDGRYVAVGGVRDVAHQRGSIHLFDRASGRLIDSSRGYPSAVNNLDFSHDGRRLAAVFGLGMGLRVLDVADLGQELASNDECLKQGEGLDFAADGRLVTSCDDGLVRLFDAQGQRIAQAPLESGKLPFDVSFSPDGQRIAVGLYDSAAVQVLSGQDLAPLYRPDTRPVDNGDLSAVAWSADGEWLHAAGRFSVLGNNSIVAWPEKGRGAPLLREAGHDTIMHLSALAGGRLAYAWGLASWSLIKPDGERERRMPSAALDHRGNLARLRMSADARQVEFGFDAWDGQRWVRSLARFDLVTRTLQTDARPSAEFQPARTVGLPVTGWQADGVPRFGGQPIGALELHERSRSLAVAADGRSFVLGTDWRLRGFDAAGQQRWQAPIPSSAFAVNLSEDGRFAVAALGDGTIRWYDAITGVERLALFIHAQDQRWVLFTPEGFYQASPEGDALIGYQVSLGAHREDILIDSAQLAGVFFRPDLITQRLAGQEAGVAEAVEAVGDVAEVLAAGRPPVVELLSPAVVESRGEVEFSVRINAGGGSVGDLRLTINGAEVPTRAVSPPGGGVVTQRLHLTAGNNVVGFRAARPDGKVLSNEVQVRVRVTSPAQRPVLRVLAVGISQYDDATYRRGVKFAARDAEKLVERLRAGAQGVYRDVDTRLLTRRTDTSLERIEAELLALTRRAQPEDVVVIFLAGHGKAPEGREYHFIPADFFYDSDQAFDRGRTLSHGRIEAVLKNLGAGKRLLILDTCDSGSAVVAGRDGTTDQKDALARLMRSTGRYILAAASQQGKALEDGVGGHGVYTAALLEGMNGKAGQPGAPMVDVDSLADYVARRVPELTRASGYEQRPMRSAQGENFPLLRPRPRSR